MDIQKMRTVKIALMNKLKEDAQKIKEEERLQRMQTNSISEKVIE